LGDHILILINYKNTGCDSVSLRNGHAWTSAWSTTQSNSIANVFTLVWLQSADISSKCYNVPI